MSPMRRRISQPEARCWLISHAQQHDDGPGLVVSVRQLASAWGWPSSTVHKWLASLRSEGVILTEPWTGGTRITLRSDWAYAAQGRHMWTPDALDALHRQITTSAGMPARTSTVAERNIIRAYLRAGFAPAEIVALACQAAHAAAGVTLAPQSIIDIEQHLRGAVQRQPPAAAIRQWAANNPPGAQLAYHRGALAEDRRQSARLADSADLATALIDAGICSHSTRRLAPGVSVYTLTVLRRDPAHPLVTGAISPMEWRALRALAERPERVSAERHIERATPTTREHAAQLLTALRIGGWVDVETSERGPLQAAPSAMAKPYVGG